MEQLFGSKTRVKLLQLFLQNPNRAFYVREITRKIDEQINSVRRELANLLNIGILKSKSRDNKLYYEVSQNYEYYPALRALFAGTDITTGKSDATAGANQEVADRLKALGAVELMVYLGVFTDDTRSGVDLLIVGDVNKTNVNNFIADLEDEENKEIKYAVMTLSEFNYRQDVHDRFLSLVEESKKTVVHDPKGLMKTEKVKPKTAKSGAKSKKKATKKKTTRKGKK